MINRICGTGLLTLVSLATILPAETVKIPLPELTGDYTSGTRQIALQLQTVFSEIDQVSLQVAGKILPGAGVMNAYGAGSCAISSEILDFTFDPDSSDSAKWTVHLTDERFNTTFPFIDSSGTQNWDFLLNGQSEISGTFTSNSDLPSPGASIFKAYLVVDGTVIRQTPREDPFPIAGDANHDGNIDVGDLGILAANYGSYDTIPSGDLNGDGSIDVSDLGIVAANGCIPRWLYNVVTFEQGDFNYDGRIDVGDLGMLAANYNSGGRSVVGVPEPVSFVLLLVGVGLLQRRR